MCPVASMVSSRTGSSPVGTIRCTTEVGMIT